MRRQLRMFMCGNTLTVHFKNSSQTSPMRIHVLRSENGERTAYRPEIKSSEFATDHRLREIQ